MKSFSSLLILLSPISYIVGYGSAIWALVSFILYLVKDIPFDRTSVQCCIGGFVFAIVAGITGLISR